MKVYFISMTLGIEMVSNISVRFCVKLRIFLIPVWTNTHYFKKCILWSFWLRFFLFKIFAFLTCAECVFKNEYSIMNQHATRMLSLSLSLSYLPVSIATELLFLYTVSYHLSKYTGWSKTCMPPPAQNWRKLGPYRWLFRKIHLIQESFTKYLDLNPPRRGYTMILRKNVFLTNFFQY